MTSLNISLPEPLRDWIEALPEDGRYAFSRADAVAVTGASDAAIKMTLYRLKRNGAIVSPRRDYFVVVPREYRSAGSPQPGTPSYGGYACEYLARIGQAECPSSKGVL